MRRLVNSAFEKAGYSIRRRTDPTPLVNDGRMSVRGLTSELGMIPGMIPTQRCELHYLLALTQTVLGDIVEIGSWQGRNTCYLAAACRDSGNGVVHAVDHFHGNPGKEDFYRVPGVSDLEAGFRTNVATAELVDWVELHAAHSRTVTIDRPVRMLVVDGEHSYEAVTDDLAQFAPLVVPGGLVIFDDYSPDFPGVSQAVNEWLGNRCAVQLEQSLLVVA